MAASAPVYQPASRLPRPRVLPRPGLPRFAGLLAAALVSGMAFGTADIAPGDSWAVLFAFDSGLLPTAGVLGALLIVTADLVGRTIVTPVELPAGLVVAAIGAPFFIALLWRQRKG